MVKRKHIFSHPYLGKGSKFTQFDWYYSTGLKPSTSWCHGYFSVVRAFRDFLVQICFGCFLANAIDVPIFPWMFCSMDFMGFWWTCSWIEEAPRPSRKTDVLVMYSTMRLTYAGQSVNLLHMVFSMNCLWSGSHSSSTTTSIVSVLPRSEDILYYWWGTSTIQFSLQPIDLCQASLTSPNVTCSVSPQTKPFKLHAFFPPTNVSRLHLRLVLVPGS